MHNYDLFRFQGFIIAFTSDAIPRLVYRLSSSPDGTLNGYLNSSLSYFNTSDFQIGISPKLLNSAVQICRYPDHREPNHPYDRTTMYWTILAARLAFVVCFEVAMQFFDVFQECEWFFFFAEPRCSSHSVRKVVHT